MNFVAIIKLDSHTDVEFKTKKLDTVEISENRFELINNYYICKEVNNLFGLIKLPDILVEAFSLDVLGSLMKQDLI